MNAGLQCVSNCLCQGVREVSSESDSYLDGFRKVRHLQLNEQLLPLQVLEKGLFCSWLHWLQEGC